MKKELLHCALRASAIVASLFFFTSCLNALLGTLNDNAQLYNTEWSAADEKEGLKFFNDDSVLFFNQYTRGAGTFEYDASTGYITFTNLSATMGSMTAEFPGAKIEDDGSMSLYWHELGRSQNYYEVLYRRR